MFCSKGAALKDQVIVQVLTYYLLGSKVTVTSHKNLDIYIIILVSVCSLIVYYFLIFLHWIGCQSQEQIF